MAISRTIIAITLAIAAGVQSGIVAAQGSRFQYTGPPIPNTFSFSDRGVGSGKEAGNSGFALFRIKGQGPERIEVRRLRSERLPSAPVQNAIDDALLGMKVGGKRLAMNPGAAIILEIELLDVAASASGLRPKSDFDDGNTTNVAQNESASAVNQVVIAPPGASVTPRYPANSPSAKAICDEEVRRHYRAGGQPSHAQTAFDWCMRRETYRANERLAQQRAREEQARQSEQAAIVQERRAVARASASENYAGLVQAARDRNKGDPTVFGIILGEQWRGTQDVNDCTIANWARNSNIPFCTYPGAGDGPTRESPIWQTCVRLDSEKLDTSWVISPQGMPQQELEGLSALFGAIFILSDRTQQCFVQVGILQTGAVGRVSVSTSLRASDIDTLLSQLRDKYKREHTRRQQTWTNGRKTAVIGWKFPNLRITYREQVENAGGVAFQGGNLEIVTAEWEQVLEDLKRKNRKQPL